MKIMNYNLCGASCNGGDFAVVDMVFRKIQAERPDIVTLQETCRDQAGRLQDLLDDAGYGMRSYFSSSRLLPAPDCGTLLPYSAGNAIYVRAAIRDAADFEFRSTDRGGGCVTAEFEVWTRVCSCTARRRTRTRPKRSRRWRRTCSRPPSGGCRSSSPVTST
nr:hypothetical protein GCM10020093_058310 [Planobispora longispora]